MEENLKENKDMNDILIPAGKVLISTDVYRELRGKAEMCNVLEGRLAAFRDYVNVKEYSIDRDVCGAILGFPVESKETGEKS